MGGSTPSTPATPSPTVSPTWSHIPIFDTYDHDTAENAIFYSYSSYCGLSTLSAWDCNFCQSHLNEFEVTDVISSGPLQSFVGFDHATSQVVISVRGSANSDNWWANIEIISTSYPHADQLSDPRLHRGFYGNYLELKEHGLTDAISAVFAQYPNSNVLCTGHSLGGALASIIALELKQAPVYSELSIGDVNVITFGAPRWCNQELAQFYEGEIDSNWRVVNRYDIAPTVPTKGMGYYHVATEVWYDYRRWWSQQDALEYQVCDGGEDPNCWGTDDWCLDPTKLLCPMHEQHLEYFGIPWGQACAVPETAVQPGGVVVSQSVVVGAVAFLCLLVIATLLNCWVTMMRRATFSRSKKVSDIDVFDDNCEKDPINVDESSDLN